MESLDEPPSWDLFLFNLATDQSFYILSGAIMLVLLILSALISGSEVAFFSLSSKDLARCREEDTAPDKHILTLARNPRKLLATILILNNFVNVAIVTLSTLMMWKVTEGLPESNIITILTPVLVTFIIVFWGEILPKVYAIQHNVNLARIAAPMLRVSQTFFTPLSFTLMKMSAIVEQRVEKKGYEVSVTELHQALELTKEDDQSDDERDILKGIVNFGTLTVRQVLKSRLDITAIEKDSDFHEVMDKINKSGFSRVPVYSETVDNIKGILYVKDLLPFIESDEKFEWQKLIRDVFFVPETKKIDMLLKDFQRKRMHMAIVVDEYGGTSGLVTLEDVIEEIIGEINDEFDDDDIAYNKLDENTYVFEGKTLLNDFCKIIEKPSSIFDDVKGDSESLGGLLLELNGKLPNVGEKITYDSFIFTVVAVDQKRIKKIRVLIKQKSVDE